MWLFDALVVLHIVSGTIGLVTLWVPLFARKGGALHRAWGGLFARALLVTGAVAVGISLVSLAFPLETHPFSDDAPLVRGLFGWMMLYLALLTIMLARYGLLVIRHRREHRALREPLNVAMQFVVFAAAANCAWRGWQLGQPVMMGISTVGLTISVLNLRYILDEDPPLNEWLIQHTRGLVGAGISVYTAFLAFGAVNLMPAHAFNPLLWATPTLLGMTLLLWHQGRIVLQRRRRRRPRASRTGLA